MYHFWGYLSIDQATGAYTIPPTSTSIPTTRTTIPNTKCYVTDPYTSTGSGAASATAAGLFIQTVTVSSFVLPQYFSMNTNAL